MSIDAKLPVVLLVLLLAGCANTSTPPDGSGPVATKQKSTDNDRRLLPPDGTHLGDIKL